MSDLISRQAALDALEWKWAGKAAIDAIKSLPSAQIWIPVSERLPEDLQEVNVTWVNRNPASYYSNIKDVPQTGCAVYYAGCWYWYSAFCTNILGEFGENDIDLIANGIEIVAWQPLPECYRGEEDVK